MINWMKKQLRLPKRKLENDIEDETLEIDEIVNIKESRNHPLENVIGNLNQRNPCISQATNRTMHLGLWYTKGTGIETVVYADSDHAGDYVDRKSTSGRRDNLKYFIQFAQILDLPCEGACVFTDKWSLDELAYGVHMDGPYQTNPPSSDDIILSIRIDREGQVTRIRREQEIDVHDYQVLTCEIEPTRKPLEEIFRENVFCQGSKRLERILAREEVVTPLLLPPPFGQPSSSYLNDDDDGNDEGTSRASTPSPHSLCQFVNQSSAISFSKPT
ncbi:hypothetical protein Tco_0946211 [Tanacetum coccineum]